MVFVIASKAEWSRTFPPEKSRTTSCSGMRSGRMRLWKLMAEPKKRGPWSLKTRVLSLSGSSTSLTSLAADHAKAKALMKRPVTTAVAKSTTIVTPVTTKMTTKSVQATRCKRPKEPHAKVLIATKNMRPTSAAIGILPTMGAKKNTLDAKPIDMMKPDNRVLPPPLTLISDWPMSAQPPCVPKRPAAMLPNPWAKHSFRVEPTEPVI
mmetsp:Transcript_37306/g.107794  ORF Transcript_37306/g.107794 Transcript_37306/m.107794 type:complete len:208 (+) Transcript_37306:276-899(+)